MSAAVEAARRWREHPDTMVRELFKVEPDPWQLEALQAFPHHPKIALKASKGVGKTCLEAWLAWNFILTRPHPKMLAVSISAENLASNFWTEMALWQSKSPLLQEMFEHTQTRIFHREFPKTWWLAARSYSKTANKAEQANTLAGHHADYVMFLIDESGSMHESIMAAAEAALSGCIEGHIVQAGNPTHLEGPLYNACTKQRDHWYVIDINGDPDNPKRAPRISVEWARAQIKAWGRDNPFVLINVFGQFPPSSLNSLIGPDEIIEATKRHYHPEDIANSPRILGVDVARQGDDASVMWPRQGLVAFIPTQYRNFDGIQGAGVVARKWEDWGADACFIDATGGFGSSWIDNLRLLGKAPFPVQFAGSPNLPRYVNKRTEMYFECVQWIKGGGQLPPEHATGMEELVAELTQTQYTFQGDKLLLEPKDMVKDKIGRSPDFADSLACTFAQPVAARNQRVRGRVTMRAEYDPFADFAKAPQRPGGVIHSDFDPYGRM